MIAGSKLVTWLAGTPGAAPARTTALSNRRPQADPEGPPMHSAASVTKGTSDRAARSDWCYENKTIPQNVAEMGSPIDEATFLSRAKVRFGGKYDYAQIIYKSYKTPIKIRCVEHPVRDIVITPEKHLQTSGGCKFCLRATRLRILEREFMIADAPEHALERPLQRPVVGQALLPNGSAPTS